MRGVWVCTVANLDWPSKSTLSPEKPEAQQKELIRILDTAKALRLNSVIFHVRSTGEAVYKSEIEPWSDYLTGQQGKPPAIDWDPLGFAIQEAHKRGLELHAWFNPYRLGLTAKPLHASHFAKRFPEKVKVYGRDWWMVPTDPDVKEHVKKVVLDVVKRYDIDGVHFDDFFYPYPVKAEGGSANVPFPDSEEYQAYRSSGGTLSKGDWRRFHVNDLIATVHREIKKVKPWVVFGISPFGIYRPNQPEGIKGLDQYNSIYADPLAWIKGGWCDYIAPQLYWNDRSPSIALGDGKCYSRLLKWWAEQATSPVKLFVGHYTDRIDPSERDWDAKEIPWQVQLARKTPGVSGQIHFRMRCLLKNTKNICDALQKTYAEVALPPCYVSSDPTHSVESIKQLEVKKSDKKCSLLWEPHSEFREPIRFWVLHAKQANQWRAIDIIGAQFCQYEIDLSALKGEPLEAVGVSALDFYRRESRLSSVALGEPNLCSASAP
jgi:uncharacterized lipoprotein YddW (UPF0748 family)